MARFFLDYVDGDGSRVRNITEGGYDDLGEAQREAAKIIAEFIGGATRSDHLGHIEIVDEAGTWVTDFHFPF